MKKKVIFVGDNHISDKQPANRIDNYLQATLNKLNDCIDLGIEHKVDALILLGDLFDRREEGPEARNGALKVLMRERNFPVYITVGNHDINNSYELDQTSLGTLIEAGVLLKEDYVEELGIAFAHFHPDLDKSILNNFLTTQDAVIWSCHASISDQKAFYEEYSVLFEEIGIHPNTSLVVSGHIHHPMRQLREDGKLFINPGAIGRRSANKDNLSRDLKILLLEYDLSGKIYTEEYLPLPSARPYNEVFNMELITETKAERESVKNFVKTVIQIKSNSWSHNSLEDKIISLTENAKEKQLNDKIIDYTVKAVQFVNENDVKKHEDFEL